jgi:hypothetical protein
MENYQISDDWDFLTRFLPSGWEEQAYTLGAIQRQRKIESASTLLRLFFIHLSDGCSLRETVTRANQGGISSISDVALLKRLRSSSEWLRWMALELLKSRQKIIPLNPLTGYNIKSVDATVISEPGSTGTDWRLHYCLNLFNLQCDQFILTQQGTGESFTNFKVSEGDLFLGDRAYGYPKGLKYVTRNGGHFLVRLRNKAFTIFDANSKKIKLLNLLKSLFIGDKMDLEIYADIQSKPRLKMRLVALRKSDKKAEESIKRAMLEQSKKQRSVNAETLKLHRYVILVSSLPDTITSQQILDLYRIRWQIEIAFKRLKSIMGIGHLPKKDEQSCQAWLHGKLLEAQLVQSIIDEGQLFSPWGYILR